MTRGKEVWKVMTKFDYEILMLLNEKNVDNPLKAINISQILEDISVAKRKSYSTAYRHLQEMTKQGYVKCGLVDGLASTYYIDELGKENVYYMDKFTVETGNKDTTELNRLTRTIKLHDMWNRQYHNTVSSIFQKHKSIDEWSQDELMKVALCGVKYINSAIEIDAINHRLDSTYQTSFEVKQNSFNLIDGLFGIIGRIKLGNLIKIFPIDKTYDGDKWGSKDYFFTMDVLKEKGLDNAVGRDGVFDLMWDYENRDLREFTVFYMSCMSAMYKQQTGVGIAEKFCEDNGIGTYTMDRENGLLIDNQSGEIAKMSNKPSFMQIVK